MDNAHIRIVDRVGGVFPVATYMGQKPFSRGLAFVNHTVVQMTVDANSRGADQDLGNRIESGQGLAQESRTMNAAVVDPLLSGLGPASVTDVFSG